MYFLKNHLMNRINIMEKIVNQTLDNKNGFIYFDSPILNKKDYQKSGSKKIDRIKNGQLYYKDEITPIPWVHIKQSTILRIFQTFKEKKIHIISEYEGKYLKMRLRNDIKFI